MSSAVLKADGTIRIPVELRRSIGASAGQKFDVVAKGNMIVLVPAIDVRETRGAMRGADTTGYREK